MNWIETIKKQRTELLFILTVGGIGFIGAMIYQLFIK